MSELAYNKHNADRGPSGALWHNCPIGELTSKMGFNYGYIDRDDFLESVIDATGVTAASYVFTQATAGTVLLASGDGGLIELDCNSTTADQGVQMQRVKAMFLPAAGRRLWFECRTKVIDTIDKTQFFAGLSEIDTSIFAAGENSSANHIGFEMNATSIASDPGKLLFVGEKAGARGSVTNVKTLVEDTFVKLGFFVNGVTDITLYVDGVANGTKIATANVPIVVMSPSFTCLTEGTNDPIVTMDWWQCAVSFN